MKVVCGSIEEFCDELRAEAEDCRIINGVVRLRIERVPDQAEQVTFQVAFMGTALIGAPGHPEYLLEFVGWSGPDGGRAGETGTKEAERWQDAVKAICDQCGVKIRKGMLELA